MTKICVVLLIAVFFSGCIEFQMPPPQMEDFQAKMSWLGEWYIPEEDKGYIFKEDGTIDWFYYKRDKRFVVKNEGNFQIYQNSLCSVVLKQTKVEKATWQIKDNLLIIHQLESFGKPEVLINLIRVD